MSSGNQACGDRQMTNTSKTPVATKDSGRVKIGGGALSF